MSDSLPKPDLLRRISNDIFKIHDCTQLAIRLDIDDDIVFSLQEETKDIHAIAFRVLKKWSRQEGASARALFDALNTDPFEHLARKYKEELLQTGAQGSSARHQHPTNVVSHVSGASTLHLGSSIDGQQLSSQAQPNSGQVSAGGGSARIKQNIAFLLRHLDPAIVLEDLLNSGVIGADEYLEVDKEQRTQGRDIAANALIHKLLLKSEEQVDKFIDCVQKYDELLEVYEKLLGVSATASSPSQHRTVMVGERTPTNIDWHGVPGAVPHLTPHFCGRQSIVSRTVDQICSVDSRRVISVVGPPGFGKTSIVISACQQLMEQGKTNVYFVSLRGLTDINQVARRIIHSLPTPKAAHSSKTSLRSLVKSLNSPSLIVLDNAEDCIESVSKLPAAGISYRLGDIVKEIIGNSTSVKILITSRVAFEPTDLTVEESRVGGLDEYQAKNLLAKLCPSTKFSEMDASSIVRWCGCVPLAVCIAAGILRYEKLTAHELLKEFRQSGLSAIEPSGEWLHPEEQLMRMLEMAVKGLPHRLQLAFYGLSLFSGSFLADAAAEVINIKDPVRFKRTVAADLQHRCFLEYDEITHCYSMQPLLSEFGRERCPEVNKWVFQRQFSLYFLNLFQQHAQHIQELKEQDSLCSFLTIETNDVRKAMEFSVFLEVDEIKTLKLIVNDYVLGSSLRAYGSSAAIFCTASSTAAEKIGDVDWRCRSLFCASLNHIQMEEWHLATQCAQLLQEVVSSSGLTDNEQCALKFAASYLTGKAHFALSNLADQQGFVDCCNQAADHLRDDLLKRKDNSLDGHCLCLLSMASGSSQRHSLRSIQQMQVAVKFVFTWLHTTCHSPNLTDKDARAITLLLDALMYAVCASLILLVPTGHGQVEELFLTRSDLVNLCTLRNRLDNQVELIKSTRKLWAVEATRGSFLMELFTESGDYGFVHEGLRQMAACLACQKRITSYGILPSTASILLHSFCNFGCTTTAQVLHSIPTLKPLFPSNPAWLRLTNCLSHQEKLFTGLQMQECRYPTVIWKDFLPTNKQQLEREQTIVVADIPFRTYASVEFRLLHYVGIFSEKEMITPEELSSLLQYMPVLRCCTHCLNTEDSTEHQASASHIQLHPCQGCEGVLFCSSQCYNSHKSIHMRYCTMLKALVHFQQQAQYSKFDSPCE